MQAAGYSMNSAIGQRAAFWNNDATHSIVDLGVFGYDWSSLANGLNDIGQAVGSYLGGILFVRDLLSAVGWTAVAFMVFAVIMLALTRDAPQAMRRQET